MTIMTVFKLCPNIVLNRVFQCEKQFCLDSFIFLCRFGGINYFLGFRTCFTLILSMVKKVVFGFLSMFFMLLIFLPDPFFALPLLFCMLGGSREVGQWCFFLGVFMCRLVGRLWFKVGDVYEMYGCVRWVQGFVGSFCFAPTVACVSRTSFVFCC
jgi:hypothetical protein